MTETRRGNPNMREGAPSVNPAGRGAAVSKSTLELASAIALNGAEVAKRTAETSKARGAPGTNGVWAPGGFLYSGERDRKLVGQQKWITQDNLVTNVAIVASAINLWLTLAGSVKWKAVENPRGGRNARKCKDLVDEGLINARMPERWRAVVRRQAMKKFRGAALHAKAYRRDSMGRQVFAALEHRPMWSVYQWLQHGEGQPWYAITQRSRSGLEIPTPIAREDLFYSVEGGVADSFEGLGLLRQLVNLADSLEGFEKLERIGFDNDMRGMGIGRAPLSKLAAEAVTFGKCDPDDAGAIKAYVNTQVKFLSDLLTNHVVTSDRSILFDSALHSAQASDGTDRLSAIYEWSFDTVRTQISGMPELGSAIGRVVGYMAMLLNVEHLLLGSSDAGGAYSMHGDKTAMLGLAIEGLVDDIQDDGERDLVWPLCARNGYNPETDAPGLEHEPIATQSLESAAKTLLMLQQGGFAPDDEAPNIIRGRMGIPARPQIDPAKLMAPGRGRTPEVGTRDSKAPTPEQNDNPDALPKGDV